MSTLMSSLFCAPRRRATRLGPRTPLLGAAAVLAVLLVLAVDPATAARERHTRVTGPQGQTAQRDVLRGQGQVSSSTTGPQGRTASRQVQRSADSTQATLTGPNGQTATRQTTRSDSGSTTTVTGPDGQSGSVSVVRQP